MYNISIKTKNKEGKVIEEGFETVHHCNFHYILDHLSHIIDIPESAAEIELKINPIQQ